MACVLKSIHVAINMRAHQMRKKTVGAMETSLPVVGTDYSYVFDVTLLISCAVVVTCMFWL